MRANPGGTIGPEDVIGRDALVAELWRVLDVQSLVLTSERRIGKTTVIRKMRDQVAADKYFCVLRDLEGLRSPQEFVESIYADVEQVLSLGDRAKLKFWQIFAKAGGAQLGDIKLPHLADQWKKLLTALLQDLSDAEKRTVIFFWDELPLFIHNVKQSSDEATAMEVLDVLRSIRQQNPKVRMVFTGSVGLHQVIGGLRKTGYANDPTNDMRTVEVPPLDASDGMELAQRLLEGEGLYPADDAAAMAHAVSEAASHIPFYIHCLVARMKHVGLAVNADAIQKCLNSLLSDDDDPAHFRFYRERLRTYYEPADERIALKVLDILAGLGRPIALAELLNLVSHGSIDSDAEEIRNVLHLLRRDHYIWNRDGAYMFRYGIIERWWKTERC